jgi:hypothetical protein
MTHNIIKVVHTVDVFCLSLLFLFGILFLFGERSRSLSLSNDDTSYKQYTRYIYT